MKYRFHSRNYFRQMLLLTVGVLLVLCLLFVGIFYTTASRSTEQNIASVEAERTEDLLRQADVYLGQLVSKNTVFSGLNIPYEQINASSTNYWTRMIFERMILSHINSDSYIKNIDIISNGISTYPSTIPHERKLGKYSVFSIYTTEQLKWPYQFDLTSYKRNGTESVTLTISGYYLSRLLFPFRDAFRSDYLILSDGTVLLTNEKPAFFGNVEDIYPGLLARAENPDEILHETEKYYYTLSQQDKYGFRVFSVVAKSVYSPQWENMVLQVIIMSLILLLIAILVSWFLTIRFYRPINGMVDLLKTYIPEDVRDYESEIAFINQNVSKYVAKGREMETVMPQTIARIQEAQAASMQHQINSHFLFNTLENIKAISVSELGMDNEIESSIMLLNSIIRESILQKNAIVSLSHEIYLANSYLQLMQIRFPDVQISWDVDNTLLTCPVFKFSLQPVLENCFIHAFKSRTDKEKRISITIMQDGMDLVIRICDNGCGIDAKTMEHLKHLLDSDEEMKTSRSVGIQNIQKRITAVFGQKYGITISSSPEKTVVSIRYPVTEAQR